MERRRPGDPPKNNMVLCFVMGANILALSVLQQHARRVLVPCGLNVIRALAAPVLQAKPGVGRFIRSKFKMACFEWHMVQKLISGS